MTQPSTTSTESFRGHARDTLTLVVPAHAEFFLLARMNASGVASMLDFGVDEIDDLKLAVNELCSLCLAGANPESRMTLTYRWNDTSIEITCQVSPLDRVEDTDDEQSELAERILEALVDEFSRSPLANASRGAQMVLHRRSAPQADE